MVTGRSYAIEAELTVPKGGAEGVIVANADFISASSVCGTRLSSRWVDAPCGAHEVGSKA